MPLISQYQVNKVQPVPVVRAVTLVKTAVTSYHLTLIHMRLIQNKSVRFTKEPSKKLANKGISR